MQSQTDDKKTDQALHQLFSYDTTENTTFDTHTKNELIKALDACKILDPACGSGAFPMGILQKMVHVLQKLDPDNSIWQDLQLQKALDETQEVFQLASKDEREERLKEINNAFDENVNSPDYARKLFLIENCIYGVDIHPIATQISKLRFFISLVVDQKNTQDSNTNFGIRPLPNLETKFVTANTLIGIEKENNLFTTKSIKDLEQELKQVRHKLFNAKTPKTKRKYRQKDKELRDQIAETLIANNFPEGEAKKLASWDPYDQNGTSPFFDPEWMFDIKEGFDVVIGNPPYIKEYTDKSVFNGLRKSKYYQGKMDLWYFFACKGIDFLKTNGCIVFIAQNNWITSEGASKFRNKVVKETTIKQFLDFRDFMIFESASIQTMVFVIEKRINQKYLIDYRKINSEKSSKKDVADLLTKSGSHIYESIEFLPNKWENKRLSFTFGITDTVLKIIADKRNFVLDKTKEVAQGIVPNPDVVNSRNIQKLSDPKISIGDGVFVIPIDYFENLSSIDKMYVKPLFEPYLVDRYKISNNDKEIIYISKTNYNDDAPFLIEHLKKFQPIMEARRENKNGRLKYYHLHWPRESSFFRKGSKILSVRKCSKPTFIYTEQEAYVMMSFNIIRTKRINQKYLTGLLNSTLIAFWLKNRGKMQGNSYQVDKGPILEIPIYKPSEDIQNIISFVVDCVIYSKKVGTTHFNILEKIIDAFIFNLYFPDHMQEKEIEVLSFVEKDIASVMQGRDFEKLIDTEKEEVINQLHKIWIHPDNEVRNRIKLFAVRSPDILKPILES